MSSGMMKGPIYSDHLSFGWVRAGRADGRGEGCGEWVVVMKSLTATSPTEAHPGRSAFPLCTEGNRMVVGRGEGNLAPTLETLRSIHRCHGNAGALDYFLKLT